MLHDEFETLCAMGSTALQELGWQEAQADHICKVCNDEQPTGDQS